MTRMRLSKCDYDYQMHEVVVAACEATHMAQLTCATFRAKVVDDGARDVDGKRAGRAIVGDVTTNGRQITVTVIEWNRERFVLVPGDYLYRIEDGWPEHWVEECGRLLATVQLQISSS